jgi:hypothetical protein
MGPTPAPHLLHGVVVSRHLTAIIILVQVLEPHRQSGHFLLSIPNQALHGGVWVHWGVGGVPGPVNLQRPDIDVVHQELKPLLF